VRRTQRYTPRMADDEAVLTANIVSLASEYGRYGYRRITALLTADGWRVNHKRVERIWRREGLKVPAKHIPSAVGCGSMTGPVSGSDRRMATTFGRTTSCSSGPAKEGP